MTPPTTPVMSQRIVSLDAVRGLALMGILLLNISGFGLPRAAYMNPAFAGTPSISDAIVWSVLSLFAQGTFLAMFALLFGATLELLRLRCVRWHLSRLGWLAVFGLLHSVLLWEGDILLTYALAGVIAAPLILSISSTRESVKLGLVLYVIGLAILLGFGLLSDNSMNGNWAPDAQRLADEAQWKLSGGALAREARWALMLSIQLSVILQYGWELIGIMLFGAALLRSGWLAGRAEMKSYRRQGWRLFLLSLGLHLPAMLLQWWVDWDFVAAGYFLQIPKEVSALVQALAYIAFWFGYAQGTPCSAITRGLASIGRLTLTNYLLQSAICTTLFYRLGGYQTFDRLSLLLFVPPIWCVNYLFSVLWLRFFRQGPCEWLWRRLTDFTAPRC